jgi:hypothetical protein
MDQYEKKRKMIYLLLLGGLVFVVVIFYIALRTTKITVTEQEPYSRYINKELVLQRPALLVKNVKAFSYLEPYLLVEVDAQLYSEITEKYLIPAGTTFELNKAVLIKNAVSGFTTSLVVGKIYVNEFQKEVDFEYLWGNEHVVLQPGAKSSWTFPLALWQKEEIKDSFIF